MNHDLLAGIDMRGVRPAVLFVLALFAVPVRAASVGVFTLAEGDVQIMRGANYLQAQQGVEVEQQDIIETGTDASAQLDMEDGSVLKLGADTRLAVSDYELDGDKNVISAGLDVLAGWVRFAVAKLKNDGRYSFQTPVLTIGVRGTEGVIEAENDSGGLQLHEGTVEVTGVGKNAQDLAPVRVTAGEYIQRLRGQRFQRLDQPPAAFLHGLPPGLQHRLRRRVLALRERGVPPRVIRAITRQDAERFLRRHPYLSDRLRNRFRPFGARLNRGAPEPGGMRRFNGAERDNPPGAGGRTFRERERFLREHPEYRERLKRRREEMREAPRRNRDGGELHDRSMIEGDGLRRMCCATMA